MRTARPALALLVPLALAGLVVPGRTASAADGTCQGRTATVATTPGSTTITGTEGNDVIAADPTTTRVAGLGGDDVICAFAYSTVEAGAGDDRVVISPVTRYETWGTQVSLGPGDDTFSGSDQSDVVDSKPLDRLGADHIDTAGGADAVGSGAPGEPNLDVIDLGAAQGYLDLALPPGSAVDARAEDTSRLTLDDTAAGSWGVDLRGREGTITHDSTAPLARVRGFRDLTAHLTSATFLDVRGNDEKNRVIISPTPRRLRVDLEDSKDALTLDDVTASTRGRVTLGGQARDSAHVSAASASPALAIALGDRRVPGRLTVSGAPSLSATASRLDVLGSADPDTIYAAGCRVRVDARGADDVVGASRPGDTAPFVCSGTTPLSTGQVVSDDTLRGARLRGGRGDDLLDGSRQDDVLVGGPGRDTAAGHAGRDTCTAERVMSCER